MKRLRSITSNLSAFLFVVLLLLFWQFVSDTGIVEKFMLPSPSSVVAAFFSDFGTMMGHSGTTLCEAFLGLAIGVSLAFLVAVLMDRFRLLYKSVYPVLVLTQTVPTVAIAPLLVFWMGNGIAPKVTLVVIVCFFPITVGLLDGFHAADPDMINLMRAMGSTKGQIFRYVKLPGSMGHFFAGLRISVSYSVVGAVIAEWLGGSNGLGVYMLRVKKAYAFDKMFAIIFLVSFISLLLMKCVELLQKLCMPWSCGRQTHS